MKDEVLYKFEVVKNIGKYSVESFGKVGTRHEMEKNGFLGVDHSHWVNRTFKELKECFSDEDNYKTVFKLVESYKIDLCKIIGVEELQEFRINNLTCRIENNVLWVHIEETWRLCMISLNDLIIAINKNEIEILPKFKLTETEVEQLKAIKLLLDKGYNTITKKGYILVNGKDVGEYAFNIEMPNLEREKEYNIDELLKHYESEGE